MEVIKKGTNLSTITVQRHDISNGGGTYSCGSGDTCYAKSSCGQKGNDTGCWVNINI